MEALSSLGRRLAAWIILVIAAIIVLKIFAGLVIGFFHAVLTVVILATVGFAVLWALRHL